MRSLTGSYDKDAKKLANAGLKPKAQKLLDVIKKTLSKTHHLTKNWLETSLELTLEGLIYNIDSFIKYMRNNAWLN